MHLICLLSSHFISSYFQTKIVISAIPDATRNIVSQFHEYTLRRILEKAFFSNMIRFRRTATDAYLEVSSSVTKGDLTQVMLTKKIVTELFSYAGSVSL